MPPTSPDRRSSHPQAVGSACIRPRDDICNRLQKPLAARSPDPVFPNIADFGRACRAASSARSRRAPRQSTAPATSAIPNHHRRARNGNRPGLPAIPATGFIAALVARALTCAISDNFRLWAMQPRPSFLASPTASRPGPAALAGRSPPAQRPPAASLARLRAFFPPLPAIPDPSSGVTNCKFQLFRVGAFCRCSPSGAGHPCGGPPVRPLVRSGQRPRLPWRYLVRPLGGVSPASHLPEPTIPVLLKGDPPCC